MLQHQPNQFDILARWRRQLAAMIRAKPWLAGALLPRSRRLLRRFIYFYRRLQALPRRWRRLLQRRLGATLAGTALLLALSGAPAQANGISVAAGVVNRDGNDGRCSLIEAIENANDAGSGRLHADCAAGNPAGADRLRLPADSVFTLHTIDNSKYGHTGLPIINSEITIEGNGSTIERGSEISFRILAVGGSGRLTLEETTISGGKGGGKNTNKGGGLYSKGTLTINKSQISGNDATKGGGVFNQEGDLTIIQSDISDNSANRHGGGLYSYTGTLTINNSAISGNQATFGGGTALGKSPTTIDNTSFSDNEASRYGGGLFNRESDLSIDNSVFSDNSANRYGGGLFNDSDGLTINQSTFSGNDAEIKGGGLYTEGDTATINTSIFSGNSVNQSGGGLYHDGNTLTINSSTISGNRANSGGGGLYSNNGLVEINNSTISTNEAEYGGGLYNDGNTIRINNSTISGNQASTNGGGLFNRYSSQIDLNRSLISGNSAVFAGSEIYNGYSDYYSSAGVINRDNYNLFGHAGLSNDQAFVRFTPGGQDINAASEGTDTPLGAILDPTLTNNGGGAETHTLVPGSPALDAIPNGQCAADGEDQRGYPRNADGDLQDQTTTECDIGAVELQPGRITITAALRNDDQVTPTIRFEEPLASRFTLTTNTAADSKTFDLPPDTVHTFRQLPLRGVGLLNVTCVDDQGRDVTPEAMVGFSLIDLAAEFSLTKGDNLTCTFLNEIRPSRLTIVTALAGDGQLERAFPFDGTLGSFTLTTNTETNSKTFDLRPDTYIIRERLTPDFSLQTVTCVDNENPARNVSAKVRIASNEPRADITLTDTDDLTCTFLNREIQFLYLPHVNSGGDQDK